MSIWASFHVYTSLLTYLTLVMTFLNYVIIHICVPWRLVHMCDMTHSYVRHDSFICVTWLIHMCDMTRSYMWHVSFICATWLVHTCDMSHSYVRHDSFICVTWLIHMCDMTRFAYYATAGAKVALQHTNESCRTYAYGMSHIWMSHVTHMNESCHTYEWVTSQTWTSHVTNMNESCHAYE